MCNHGSIFCEASWTEIFLSRYLVRNTCALAHQLGHFFFFYCWKAIFCFTWLDFNTLSIKFCFSPRKHVYSAADTPLVNLMVRFVYTVAVVLIRLPIWLIGLWALMVSPTLGIPQDDTHVRAIFCTLPSHTRVYLQQLASHLVSSLNCIVGLSELWGKILAHLDGRRG